MNLNNIRRDAIDCKLTNSNHMATKNPALSEKGFVLVGFLFMLTLVAVTALGLNHRTGMHTKMAANRVNSLQSLLGRRAGIDLAVLKLMGEPSWRTGETGETFVFNGITYNRKVLDITIPDYSNTIAITCTRPGSLQAVSEIIQLNVGRDIYIADADHHRIRKVAGANDIIETIAGNGSGGYSADDVLATSTSINQPADIWVDTQGNIYMADTANDRIRMVAAATGIITTVAGIGRDDYPGDGGPATSCTLDNPQSVFVDSSGSIYIADTGHHLVRRVDVFTGIIDRLAGTGSAGYSGDGGPGTSAQIKLPGGICADSSGNVYFADTDNHRIRKVAAASGIVSTVAGTGSGGYSGDDGPATSAKIKKPAGIYIDSSDHIYFADKENNRIRKIDTTTGVITTVAGNGERGYWGDAEPAPRAQVNTPQGAQMDAAGNLYIADTDNHRIRKVDAENGLVTTIAGTGTAGYSGDGGPASSAQLKTPGGLWVDEWSNVYIVDTQNHRIRKIDAVTGIITTVAGIGDDGYAGDGGQATSAKLKEPQGIYVESDLNLFIADTGNHRIRKVNLTTGIITTAAGNGSGGYAGDNGPATSAKLKEPQGAGLDAAGNIFIADTVNHCVRKVNVETGIITTVAGNGSGGYAGDNGPATSAKLKEPRGIFVDNAGNIFVADTENNRIRKVEAATGTITTVAGNGDSGFSGDDGPAISSQINKPGGVWLTATDTLIIADSNNDRIRKVEAGTGIITTIAGNGESGYWGDALPATEAELNFPQGIYGDAAGNLYIADTENHRIRKVHADTGIITCIAGNGSDGFDGDGQPAIDVRLNTPRGVYVDLAGNILIADTLNHRIRQVTEATGIINTVAGNGTRAYGGDDGPATSAQLDTPGALYGDAGGNLYVVDSGNHRIRKIDPTTGIIVTIVGIGDDEYIGEGAPAVLAALDHPQSVRVDESGDIYIADTDNHRIRKVDSATGIINTVAGNGVAGYMGDDGPAVSAQLKKPGSLFLDQYGNIFVADTDNHRIRKVDAASGTITTVVGDGSGDYSGDGIPATIASINKPAGVWVDDIGNIFIADTKNHRIRKVDSGTGFISTIAGDGFPNFGGDGHAATDAELNNPEGVGVDGAGNVYIADTGNHRIRKIDVGTGKIETVAGKGIGDPTNLDYPNDGEIATKAYLKNPTGVWVDPKAKYGISVSWP